MILVIAPRSVSRDWARSLARAKAAPPALPASRVLYDSYALALMDDLVEQGVGDSRSAVIRRGVHHLAGTVRRARAGAAIAQSYRELPQTAEDDALAMANALAMTEAEPLAGCR